MRTRTYLARAGGASFKSSVAPVEGSAATCRQATASSDTCNEPSAADPVERHAVERAGGAEIDVDPLFARAGAFPGAGETMRSADGDGLSAAEQGDFGGAPGARAGG